MNNTGKTKVGIGITLLALISLLTLINGCIEEKQESPVKLNLTVYPLEEVNGENYADVTLTVQSDTDMQNVIGEITLEEGLELSKGSLKWQAGHLQANQPQEFKITVKAPEGGSFGVTATAKDSLPIKADSAIRIVSSTAYYYTEDKWRKETLRRMDRYNTICDPDCRMPEPLKGQELNNYFKSLNLEDDPIYVMLQYDQKQLLNSLPSPLTKELYLESLNEREETIKEEGVEILIQGGDKASLAKAPKRFLEEKHYDFIRWIGIPNPKAKLPTNMREKIWDKHCTGKIELRITFYESPDYWQRRKLKQTANSDITSREGNTGKIKTTADKIQQIATLNSIREIRLGGSEVNVCFANICPSPPDPLGGITCID